jgi:hypothetical protein
VGLALWTFLLARSLSLDESGLCNHQHTHRFLALNVFPAAACCKLLEESKEEIDKHCYCI